MSRNWSAGDAVNPYTGKVYARYPFSAFWLVNGAACALCGAQTMYTFIVVPLTSLVCTMVFSSLHVNLLGREGASRTICQTLHLAHIFEVSRVADGPADEKELEKPQLASADLPPGDAARPEDGKADTLEELKVAA
eukprot:scaffold3740_cov322-Prasinococcus_capsulatus_cf.AAC.6